MQVSRPTIYVTENQKEWTIGTRDVLGELVLQLAAAL
jgi:hypothetical protein